MKKKIEFIAITFTNLKKGEKAVATAHIRITTDDGYSKIKTATAWVPSEVLRDVGMIFMDRLNENPEEIAEKRGKVSQLIDELSGGGFEGKKNLLKEATIAVVGREIESVYDIPSFYLNEVAEYLRRAAQYKEEKHGIN